MITLNDASVHTAPTSPRSTSVLILSVSVPIFCVDPFSGEQSYPPEYGTTAQGLKSTVRQVVQEDTRKHGFRVSFHKIYNL